MKYILILTTFFMSILCFGQELTVKSFTEQTNDISARSNPRNDLNDNPCALVKVRLAVDNATFKGMVVGDVKHDAGEYYVYMPEGSKKLTAIAPNYLPLDVEFSDFKIRSLVGKTTYLLTIRSSSSYVSATTIQSTVGRNVSNSMSQDANTNKANDALVELVQKASAFYQVNIGFTTLDKFAEDNFKDLSKEQVTAALKKPALSLSDGTCLFSYSKDDSKRVINSIFIVKSSTRKKQILELLGNEFVWEDPFDAWKEKLDKKKIGEP